MKTRVVVKRYGSIDEGFISWIIGILDSVYKTSEEPPLIVELHVYESNDLYRTYALLERLSLDIKHLDVEEYLAYHDAWYGVPRIHVIYEVSNRVNKHVFKSAIIHEAVHSILHGDVASYLVTLPQKLNSLTLNDNVKWEFITIIASSIKDVEVTSYILERKLDPNLLDFIRYNVRISEEDLELLRLAVEGYEFKLLAIASLLKMLAPLSSLLLYNIVSDELIEEVDNIICKYPNDISDIVWRLVREVIPSIRGDLQDKLDTITDFIIDSIM